MDTSIVRDISNIIENILNYFRYSDMVLTIPFGINILAFLLNVESLIRYWKSSKILFFSISILCLFILYKLNLKITASSEVTDVRIIVISVALVVLGVILSLSPFWVLNKNKLEK